MSINYMSGALGPPARTQKQVETEGRGLTVGSQWPSMDMPMRFELSPRKQGRERKKVGDMGLAKGRCRSPVGLLLRKRGFT